MKYNGDMEDSPDSRLYLSLNRQCGNAFKPHTISAMTLFFMSDHLFGTITFSEPRWSDFQSSPASPSDNSACCKGAADVLAQISYTDSQRTASESLEALKLWLFWKVSPSSFREKPETVLYRHLLTPPNCVKDV